MVLRFFKHNILCPFSFPRNFLTHLGVKIGSKFELFLSAACYKTRKALAVAVESFSLVLLIISKLIFQLVFVEIAY